MAPPRKKQRTGTPTAGQSPSTTAAAVAPDAPQIITRRITRAAARQAQLGAMITTTGTETENVLPVNGNAKRKQRGRTTPRAKDGDTAVKRVTLKGRLHLLPDIALEIQFMIYNQLQSRDLHHLSRTCKKFRAFFLNKKLAEKLWECARRNTDSLPPRPPFMSEPAFIHLLYTSNCHYCGAQGVRKILHGCFIRLCPSCFENSTTDTDWLSSEYNKHTNTNLHGNRLLRSLFYYDDEAVLPTFDGGRWKDGREKPRRLLKSDAKNIIERLAQLPQPCTAEDTEAFKKALVEEQDLRLQYSEPVQTWSNDREDHRKQELKDLRQRRFETILVRLRDAGWGPELDFLGEDDVNKIAKMPVVRQSCKLTEGSWNKVLVSLDKLLNDTRMRRCRAEHCDVLHPRFADLEEALQAHYVTLPRNARMDCRPTYIDLALMPECRAIIDVPASVTVTAEDVAAGIPAVVEKWEANMKKELTAYIRPHLPKITRRNPDPLTLAIAVFNCKHDRVPLHWPDMLVHRCFHSVHADMDDSKDDDAYTYAAKVMNLEQPTFYPPCDLYGNEKHNVPFRTSDLTSESEDARRAVDRMSAIVSACGLNPSKATIEDLERTDAWLWCTYCDEDSGRRRVMKWRAAFEHYSTFCSVDDHKWSRVDKDDVRLVHAVYEKASREPKWRYNLMDLDLSCSLCSAFDAPLYAMQVHLKKTHGLDDLIQALHDGIIYCHPSYLDLWSSMHSYVIDL
ncbi:hypothetical protein C2E23DRAFT_215301 [Lenzites betulinus]|nr:hypothetical protein C2E23DRAFT_215301 [Lenzites betulinus]